MTFVIGRVSPMLRAGNYRPSNYQVRFSHSQTLEASKLKSAHRSTFLEQRIEKVAFQELKQNKMISHPDPAPDKYAHYEKLKSTKPGRFDKLKFIGAAPEELDENTCRQSWELNREMEKRIIKKTK